MKIKVGIDINEVFRAKWLQFDRFYAQEFGEEGIPENPYTYDFFRDYRWEDTTEVTNELREPDDIPEDINLLDYQIDEETGIAPADFLLFKPSEKKIVQTKEQYNRFMYEDYLLEIHGTAPIMYKGLDLHMKDFHETYARYACFTLLSVENPFTIPPTLFFLSRMMSRFRNYRFVDTSADLWKGVDVLITTDPTVLEGKIPFGKKLIKVIRPYNKDIKVKGIEILQVADLIGNEWFEKLVGYKEKKND